MSFEDHFSQHAESYARHRPIYPAALFAYLASIAPTHRVAWDCGTGSGQAALALADYFDRVVATDASPEQIAHAVPHERIDYRVERAEAVSLDSSSVDLITVAVAVHWFDLEAFYREARRVLRAGGILAVWTYHLPAVTPEVDGAVSTYYRDVLAGYWPPRIRYVDERYRTLPFPFEEVRPPAFEMEANWSLSQLLGFLDSWSAARAYQKARGQHPVEAVWTTLAAAWGEPERRRLVRWPLHLRVGRAD